MFRPFLVGLFAFGTIAGFGSGFAHVAAWRAQHGYGCHRWGAIERPIDQVNPTQNVQAQAPAQAQTIAPVIAPTFAPPASQTLVIPILIGAPAQAGSAGASAPIQPTVIQVPVPAAHAPALAPVQVPAAQAPAHP